jgi:hypothetical protein
MERFGLIACRALAGWETAREDNMQEARRSESYDKP